MIKLDYCGPSKIGEPTSDGDEIAATSSEEEADFGGPTSVRLRLTPPPGRRQKGIENN